MTAQDENEYLEVPSDFPRPGLLGAIPGSQPKFIATQYKDKFYPPGCTPPEQYERWKSCEEIVQEFAYELKRDKADNLLLRSEIETLDKYLKIFSSSWLSENEAKWVIRRIALLLSWPVPTSASI
ncbi:hypothetical protein QPK32_25805 [Massilia sp. YIM B02763]|uniref:hypothetical protein n=1 Tax=Massilia sp. YIM B02763 TaxID=3050130 RepID=UPI0025B6E13B|nr:hypothetical protein [Massilia sp. YIM B02763]MDN4056478.1 hypothetical protein [Massilia sp. YIM B02763]